MKNSLKYFHLFLITLTLVLTQLNVSGQHKFRGSNLLLEGRVNYGFLINHHLEMQIFNSHFPAFEINLGKETFGEYRWQRMYSYPFIGVSYWYSHLGNSPLLGSAHAVFPYVNYPLIRDQKHELNFRLGLGLAYLTQKFDRIENYKYLAIGSHVNAAANLMFEYRWMFSPRMNAAIGLALMHFSNGSMKTPNYGINIPSLNLGLSYRLSKANPYLTRKMLPELYVFEFDGKRSVTLDLGATIAYKDMGSEYGRTFMIYNVFGNVVKPVSFKSAVGAGFDLTIDRSDPFFLKRKGMEFDREFQKMRIGLNAAYQLSMSKLSYMFNLGFYVSGKVRPSISYFKLGLHYDITPQVFATLALRTHFAQADYVGFGLGYKLPLYYYNLKKKK
ncbi:MAG: acyloxyacyl hydrolase [Bacteroidales bacterium]|nr:acyloxyacyl hydrolase [Bacteroidales bacterium]